MILTALAPISSATRRTPPVAFSASQLPFRIASISPRSGNLAGNGLHVVRVDSVVYDNQRRLLSRLTTCSQARRLLFNIIELIAPDFSAPKAMRTVQKVPPLADASRQKWRSVRDHKPFGYGLGTSGLHRYGIGTLMWFWRTPPARPERAQPINQPRGHCREAPCRLSPFGPLGICCTPQCYC